MEKTVSAYEARRNFGKYLQDVAAKGNNIVVERHGEPVAVVVPISVYKQWQRRREEFFDWLEKMAERANVPEEEADELIEEAIQAVRAEQRKLASKST
jgi:prevent-host-death family protein